MTLEGVTCASGEANKVKGLLAIGAIVGTCYSFVFVRFLGDTVAIFIFDNKIGVY